MKLNKLWKTIIICLTIILIIIFSYMTLFNRKVYETEILCSKEYQFDDTFEVKLDDPSFGEVSIKEIPNLGSYCIHSKFKKRGNTKLSLKSSDGIEYLFNLEISDFKFNISEIKNKEVINNMKLYIDNIEYNMTFEDNDTTNDFIKLLPNKYTMNELNGNEYYVYLDNTLKTNSTIPDQIEAGDVMLYGNNCLVIFYKSFKTTYSYTKIGHIDSLKELNKESIVVEFK